MPVICGKVFFPTLHLLLAGVVLNSTTWNVKGVWGRQIRGSRLIHLETSTSPVGDNHIQDSNTDCEMQIHWTLPHYSPNHPSGAPHNSHLESRPLKGVDLKDKFILRTKFQRVYSTCSIGGQHIYAYISLLLYTNDYCANNKWSLHIWTGLFWADVSLVIPNLFRH